MSLSAEIDLEFADGEYHFALPLPQAIEVEEKCGFVDAQGNRRRRGLIAIFGDIVDGLAVVDGKIVAVPSQGRASAWDCREIIRLALIGGRYGIVDGKRVEVTPILARQLCERYVDGRPLVERWTLAAAILKAAVEGFEPPKVEPAKAPATAKRGRARKSRST